MNDPNHADQSDRPAFPSAGKTPEHSGNQDDFAINTADALQSQEMRKAELAGREQVEEALKASEQMAQSRLDEVEAIYATAPIGLCVLDTHLRYVRINNRLAEINGMTVEQHLGKTIREIIPDIADEAEVVLRQIIETGQPVRNIEIKGETPAQPGVERTWLEHWLPFKNHQGVVVGINIVAEEITERKRQEAELQRYQKEIALANKELAATNEELAAANEEFITYNEDMSKANALLSQVNTDLDNFVYTASHDLKAPVSNIQGLIQLLERNLSSEDKSTPATQKALEMMKQSIARFTNTIADLTEVARLQKQFDQPIKLIDLCEVIQQVMQDIAPDIEKADAQIMVEVDGCGPVRFAPKNLRSVVYNLLSNAIKYSDPHRKLVIRIACKETKGYQILSVADNGLGVDMKYKKKLFAMFQRLHTHVEGSGVGLYIVKKVIENAGGKIEVESQVGQGTTFKVFLKS